MALNWRPVGPLPAETYWRRRAVVAGAAVLVLVLLVWSLSALAGDGDAEELRGPDASASPSGLAAPSGSPSASATATPTGSPTASPSPQASAAPCPDTALSVEAAPADDAYAVGASVRLSLVVRNTGTVPCRRDLGQAAVELLVTSGPDRIWSSDDCAPGGEADPRTLAPGEAYTATVTWPGRRSRPGCPDGLEAARAGTYRVTGRVGELRSEGTSFRLTG